MPTEQEVLAEGFHVAAQTASESLAVLHVHIAALTQFALNPEQTQRVDLLGQEHLARVRGMEFGAARMRALVAQATQADRQLFSITMLAVDVCRFARATPVDGPEPDARTLALADAVENAMADMQELLRVRFPGENCPGD